MPEPRNSFFCSNNAYFYSSYSFRDKPSVRYRSPEYWAGTMSACWGYILPSLNVEFKRRAVTEAEGSDRGVIFTSKRKPLKGEEQPLNNVGKL